MKVVVCITGASGVCYAKRLLEVLREKDVKISLIISESGKRVIERELDVGLDYLIDLSHEYYENNDFFSPLASGSHIFHSVVVVPCSMKTLSAVANGYSSNLICRVCDVAIKERRQLILMPREMPFNSIHLENMLKLSKLGVTIMPPIPAFYGNPKRIEDLIDFVVGRVLDNLGIPNDLFKRWEGV